MELSALDTALISAVVALLSVVLTVLAMTHSNNERYVTKEACNAERAIQCTERKALHDELSSVKRSLAISLRMNRALITYSDLPTKVKEEVLNDRG